MVKNLEELWKNRLANQKFPLIGRNRPGEGNGFHDRHSFNIPYHLLSQDYAPHYSSWLYSVYFRDLANLLNPKYKNDGGEDFHSAIKLENCSKNFQDTFLKYLGGLDKWRNDAILEILGHWGNYLINHGRVVIEFVGWYDNDTQDFYAYELEQLSLTNCNIKKNYVLFSAPVQDENNQVKRVNVEIPKSKCIIIDWPKELGSFSFYKETVKSILAIDDMKNSVEKMKDWDLKFNNLTSDWGTKNPLENTTEFYKQYNFFTLKRTLIYCTYALIDGLRQLVTLLNEKLSEEAKLTFDYKEVDVEKYHEMKSKWMEGKLSFKESSKFLTFN